MEFYFVGKIKLCEAIGWSGIIDYLRCIYLCTDAIKYIFFDVSKCYGVVLCGEV